MKDGERKILLGWLNSEVDIKNPYTELCICRNKTFKNTNINKYKGRVARIED